MFYWVISQRFEGLSVATASIIYNDPILKSVQVIGVTTKKNKYSALDQELGSGQEETEIRGYKVGDACLSVASIWKTGRL